MKTAVLSIGDQSVVGRLAEVIRTGGDNRVYDSANTLTLAIYDSAGELETIGAFHDILQSATTPGKIIRAYGSVGHLKKTPCLSRGFYYWYFWTAFEFLKIKVLFATCSVKNNRSKRFLELMGFKFSGLTKYGYDDDTDLMDFKMEPKDCHWWPDGKVYTEDFPLLTALKPRD